VIDPDRFAALLCDWCLQVAPGELIVVQSTRLAEPLLDAMQIAVLERDAWPVIEMDSPARQAAFFAHARDRHLDGPSPADLALADRLDARVRIDAPANAAALAEVPPARMARAARGLADIRERYQARRWAVTLWPTPSHAQLAGMSEAQFEAFVERALFLDHDDPIAAWQALSARQATLVARLSQARTIRIEADGTDLTLDVTGRTWLNSDGRRNMPSGEVFTGPHEGSANGTVHFTVPTGPPGVPVSGVRLSFQDGKVVKASAEQGQDYLDATLETDPGARFLGEIGIGTNTGIDRATGKILLDEKMAGTVHLALGRSYPESGGTNESAVHWDLICDLRNGGRITADGEPLVIDPSAEIDKTV
jgi:aminopeptidase